MDSCLIFIHTTYLIFTFNLIIYSWFFFKFQARPKAVEPVDYETYVSKNKTILHNDPQREMLTFPYDDIVIPVSQVNI